METPVQTAVRMLSALDDLAIREENLLRAMDFVGAVAVQERAGPVIQKLVELARYPAVAALQSRVGALLARREQSRLFLDAQLARSRSELRRIDEARARLAGLAPAYGTGTAAPLSRFNAAA